MIFTQAKGKALDKIGNLYGVNRKRWLWVFRESDEAYRLRILRVITWRSGGAA